MAAPRENSDLLNQKITSRDVLYLGGMLMGMVVAYYSGRTNQALTDQRQDIKLEQLDKSVQKITDSNDKIINLLERLNPEKK